ncbi:undecaprenyl-diphosphatase [Sporomusaceae bacterium BoRhaA]|uniref:phosphatase PAP2 family protein n=1 Tax=Pelorhabdus rhamnosifermentans TaxID=2772457 RepID=UPI001FEA9300|nr:phosphatase PAP2 family protein [Pelorhabdus rhamnosifermentans]MBU2699376.1 undecaprenyl-diphosphatase [Pelorhabdus rhamnosifermentans]
MKLQNVKLNYGFICWVLLQSVVLAYGGGNYAPSDIFSHTDIQIEADQVINRLMVAEGNAVVLGNIKEGIVIVDGNLLIAPTAQIDGSIIVLGGYIEQQQGSQTSGHLFNLKPQRFPMMNLVIGSLSLLAMLSLIILPFIIWLMFNIFKRFPCYVRLKNGFYRMQHRWPLLYIILTLGLSCSMLVLFSELAWKTIFRHTMGMFDNILIWLVRYFANPTLDSIMIFISNLGYGSIYGFIVVAAFTILVMYRRWLEFAGLAICLSGGAILNYILKNLFERARPDAFRIVAASGYSFPSGHAMVSIYFYGMLAFLIARNIKSWQWRYVLTAITILFIVVMGISRIYLGVHYPSDVVAGYTAGGMWLMFNISLLMWWERNR